MLKEVENTGKRNPQKIVQILHKYCEIYPPPPPTQKNVHQSKLCRK